MPILTSRWGSFARASPRGRINYGRAAARTGFAAQRFGQFARSRRPRHPDKLASGRFIFRQGGWNVVFLETSASDLYRPSP
jgi:hypothetical protein